MLRAHHNGPRRLAGQILIFNVQSTANVILEQNASHHVARESLMDLLLLLVVTEHLS